MSQQESHNPCEECVCNAALLTFSLFMIKSWLAERANVIFQTVVTYGFAQDNITLGQECAGSTECPSTLWEQSQLLFPSSKQILIGIVILITSKSPSLSTQPQFCFIVIFSEILNVLGSNLGTHIWLNLVFSPSTLNVQRCLAYFNQIMQFVMPNFIKRVSTNLFTRV